MTTAGAKFPVETNYQALWQFGKWVRRKKRTFFFLYPDTVNFTPFGLWWWMWKLSDTEGSSGSREWVLFPAAGICSVQQEGWHKALKLPNISFSQTSSLPNQMEPLFSNFHALWVSPFEAAQQNSCCSFQKIQGMGKDLFLTTWNSWRIPVSLTNITHWNYLQHSNSSKFLVKGFPKHPKIVPAARFPSHQQRESHLGATGCYSWGRCEPGSGFANIPSNFRASLAAAEFVVWRMNNMGNFHHRD